MGAQELISQPLVANSPNQSTQSKTEWTGFLKYEPPFKEPTLTLKYEIEYSLNDIINTFKSMIFSENDQLPQQLAEMNKFSKRSCTFSKQSKSKKNEFKGNENGNLCEVLKFDTTLLPLLPGFDPKEYEQKVKENEKNESVTGWNSWTSMNAWKEWGSSQINSWMEYFKMEMTATEIWKIDWIQHRAVSFVKNVSMSWTVGVYEYTELEQLMHITSINEEQKENDKKVKVIFVKKLFVSPIVPMPQFAMDALKEQYRKDSDIQIKVIKALCKNPLSRNGQNESLQQLKDV